MIIDGQKIYTDEENKETAEAEEKEILKLIAEQGMVLVLN